MEAMKETGDEVIKNGTVNLTTSPCRRSPSPVGNQGEDLRRISLRLNRSLRSLLMLPRWSQGNQGEDQRKLRTRVSKEFILFERFTPINCNCLIFINTHNRY